MQSHEERSGLYTRGAFLILILGLAGGVALDRLAGIGLAANDAAPNFHLITQAWGIIYRYYVDRSAVQARPLTYGAISGMVNALGDTGHSRFLSPQMRVELNKLEQNKFQGIGAEIQLKAGHIVVVAPLDGSPAQRAGLKPGDIILKVNGRDVAGWPLDQVVQEVSGPAGSSVNLTILAPASGKTREVTLTRATVNMHNITWQMLPGTRIVHLRVAAFEKGVTDELRKALTDIKKETAAGMVLDLRNNPGGLLGEAVSSASQFLRGGNVLLVKNARGQENSVPVEPGGDATAIPLVGLVNGGTASGAEIVAGALQDASRAPLVGEPTFGTGTVLSEFNLPDGSALLLAVEEWLTPAGHVIWHKGITPNVVVALPAGELPVLPDAERSMSAEEVRQSREPQLLKAIELLRHPEPEGQKPITSGLPRSQAVTSNIAGEMGSTRFFPLGPRLATVDECVKRQLTRTTCARALCF
jgi:carboxyl-terminal processing protease